MNAPTATRTIRVDTVTLHRTQLAAIFAEWTRLQRAGQIASWPPETLTLAGAGFLAADWLIELACREAAGAIEPVSEPRHLRAFTPAEPTAPDPEVLAEAKDMTPQEATLFARLARLGEGASFLPCFEEQLKAAEGLVSKGLAVRDEDDDQPHLRLSTIGRAIAEARGL